MTQFYTFFIVNNAALKIHITAEMNDQLNSIGGFKTEHRGLIDVKVKPFEISWLQFVRFGELLILALHCK